MLNLYFWLLADGPLFLSSYWWESEEFFIGFSGSISLYGQGEEKEQRKCILQFHRLWSYCRTDFSLCFRVLLTFTNDCHQCHTVSPTINLSAGRGSELLPRQLVSNRNWPASLHRTVPPVTNGNRCVKLKIFLLLGKIHPKNRLDICHYLLMIDLITVRLLVQQFWYLEAIQ